MNRRPVRILFGLVGLCLLVGLILSFLIWYAPQDRDYLRAMRRFSVLVDIFGFAVWMLAFAFYARLRNK